MLSEKEKLEFLDFAKTIAENAGKVTLEHYGIISEFERKSDNSPVTVADRESEVFIRSEILSEYPTHSIMGEEFENKDTDSDFRWIIDPIDGTSSFVRAVPLYTVLLALQYRGSPVLGVIHAPRTSETVYAALEVGCFFNGKRAHVSSTEKLENAWVQVTDYADLKKRRPEFTERLLNRAISCRTWGDAYGYLLVATGRADVMIDPIMAPWDIAPLFPIISEAGGIFTDLDGNPNVMGNSALACNQMLHDEIMRII
ncbi:MAG: inositol monophosphatase family protein [Candidatus Thorarchaeota archaeon]